MCRTFGARRENSLCLCVSVFEIYCFRLLKKQGKWRKQLMRKPSVPSVLSVFL